MGASRQQLIQLRECLEGKFSLAEIKDLCFYLRLDYENIPGDTKADKTRELLLFLNRRDQVDELVDVGKQLRPDVDWASVVRTDEQQPPTTPQSKQSDDTDDEQIEAEDADVPEHVLLKSLAYLGPISTGKTNRLGTPGSLSITNRRLVFTSELRSLEFSLSSIEDAEAIRDAKHFNYALGFRARGKAYTFTFSALGRLGGTSVDGKTALEKLEQAQAENARESE